MRGEGRGRRERGEGGKAMRGAGRGGEREWREGRQWEPGGGREREEGGKAMRGGGGGGGEARGGQGGSSRTIL